MFMGENPLRIPKRERTVTLWVHPDGPVVGALFLHMPAPDQPEGEGPIDLLNSDDDFLVVKRADPEPLTFYNKSSVIRVEYQPEQSAPTDGARDLPCRVHMMDGSVLDGFMRRDLPPERSRLYDYMNAERGRFLTLHFEDGMVHLVNKSYIVSISVR